MNFMTPDPTRLCPLSFIDSVKVFMEIAGQTTIKFNPRQASLYTGLQCEELAEKLSVIAQGCLTPSERAAMLRLALEIDSLGKNFKEGLHEGALLRADHAELIDADFDLAWVSTGAALSTATDAKSAFSHGAYTNLDKFRGGVAVKDENGKVRKPADWHAPDFAPFVDPMPRM